MLLPAPPLRLRKPRANPFRVPKAPPAPPGPLVLVAAEYDNDGAWIDLAFDRAIEIDAMDVTLVVVDDDTYRGLTLAGFGTPVLVTPTTVRVVLDEVGGATQADVHLTAGAGNGIVAVDDGAAWAGAEDVELPFP
ncbi:MAG: hypothetical protein WBD40_12850 [Tepidisphaeraceae bacterium]